MDNTDEIIAEANRIPTGTRVIRLVKHEDGHITARRDLTEAEVRNHPNFHQYHMSEVRTTNAAHTRILLERDEFEPSLYRCTFTDFESNPNDGFDYSIGFLPADMLKQDNIEVDEVIGVTGEFPGAPAEVVDELRNRGIGDVYTANEMEVV